MAKVGCLQRRAWEGEGVVVRCAIIPNISQTSSSVAAQGLSRPAVVNLHPLALEGFVSCACAPVVCLVPNLSIPLRPRAAGGGEQHVRILSKAQHAVGPVPSRPAEANHLSGCNKRSRWAAPKPLLRLHSARCPHRSQLGLMYS